MMADVDELITSISRPGTCSGMATFIRKIATGLSSAIIGLMLGMIGYDEIAASSGLRQAASVQSGIAYIYIFVPVILMALTIFVALKFPMKQREFEIIRKEIARRKGEDSSLVSDEEKKVCETVTGFAYENLWNKENALKL